MLIMFTIVSVKIQIITAEIVEKKWEDHRQSVVRSYNRWRSAKMTRQWLM